MSVLGGVGLGGSGGGLSGPIGITGTVGVTFGVIGTTGLATSAKQDTTILNLQAINSLVPSTYDYISLTYTGDDLTSVVFKTGGSGGSTVSTLTLTYTSNILQTVTRT